MKPKIFLILCSLLIVGCSQKEDHAADSDATLTQQEILDVATKVAADMDLPMEHIRPYYDVNNVQWSDFCVSLKEEDPKDYEWASSRLRNRSYQVVRLRPEPGKVLDGSFWVVVDKKTGGVILTIQDL